MLLGVFEQGNILHISSRRAQSNSRQISFQIACYLSSVLWPLSSDLCPLSSVLNYLTSILSPLYSPHHHPLSALCFLPRFFCSLSPLPYSPLSFFRSLPSVLCSIPSALYLLFSTLCNPPHSAFYFFLAVNAYKMKSNELTNKWYNDVKVFCIDNALQTFEIINETVCVCNNELGMILRYDMSLWCIAFHDSLH